MLVTVLRNAQGDFTNKGVTSRATTLLLVGEGVPEIFEESPRVPTLVLVRRWAGTPNEYLHAEPLEQPAGGVGPMAGGNFVYSTDGRFRDLCPYPISVHDRFETVEQYASYD
jgi:hypothetical protein